MIETDSCPLFTIDTLITQEVDERKLPDFKGLEILLNEKVKGISFGKDLKQIEFRFDVFGYGGSFEAFFKELGIKSSHLPSKKKLSFNFHVNYNDFKSLGVEEQCLTVKELILGALEGTAKRKKIKDSDINMEKLQKAINDTIAEYLETYLEPAY